MKAVVKAATAPGAEIRDVPVPSAGPGEVLLRVLRAGVCGTDLHIWNWDRWSQGRIKPPVTLGHEFVGEIVERGPASRISPWASGWRARATSCARPASAAARERPRLREHAHPPAWT
jgi:threonine dehydrogenase-like Zn-dependent dehydrogenase